MRTLSLLLLLMGIGLSLTAQTGPGGVGDNTDNILWLRADQGTGTATNTGDPVANWSDTSGNDHDFTGSAGNSSKPEFQKNAINGYPAIDFTGDGDEMTDSDGNNYINGLDEFTVFFVIKSDTTNVEKGLLDTESPNGQDDVFTFRYDKSGFDGGGDSLIKGGILNNNVDNRIESSSNTQTTNIQLLTFHWKDNNPLELFIDGSKNTLSNASNSPTGSISNASNVVIGKGSQDGSGSSWDGLIAEVIIYDRQLDAVEREIVDNYLGEKYGKAVGNDLYSSSTGFDRSLIGIGQKAGVSHTKSKADGLTIQNNTGLANGDFLLAGHDVKNNSINQSPNSCSGCSESLDARWKRVWYMDETDPGNDLKVDLTFDLSEGGFPGPSAGSASDYELLYRSSTTGSWTSAGQASSVSGDEITFTNIAINDDNYYTIGTTNETNSPLPVELISFNVTKKKGKVFLKWETASETQNSHFMVQRKTDNQWQNLGKVEGQGTTTEPQSYRFEHENYSMGPNYYRLKQVDYDGSFEYSSVKVIRVEDQQANEVKVLKNPVNQEVRLRFYANDRQVFIYRLMNGQGKLVKRGKWQLTKGGHDLSIPLNNRESGIYWLSIQNQQNQWHKKILK